MTPRVSIVIPIAPYHDDIALRAVQSARAQTVENVIVVVQDTAQRGAGYARNRGLDKVTTPFVVFLDADDLLHPQFLEKTLAAYQERHYVYTDWNDGAGVKFGARPWCMADWHPVTTLLLTTDAKAVRFDETMQGGEDSTFYFALTRSGICPVRVSEPLFSYQKGGQRARAWVTSAAYEAWKQVIKVRYPDSMGCCGDNNNNPPAPVGQAQPGDVWTQAIWGGNTVKRGKVSGRLYPRTGNGKWLWVNKADVQAQPELFREAHIIVGQAQVRPSVLSSAPVAQSVMELARNVWPNRPVIEPEPTVEDIEQVAVSPSRPNVARIKALAGVQGGAAPQSEILRTADGDIVEVIEEKPDGSPKPKRKAGRPRKAR